MAEEDTKKIDVRTEPLVFAEEKKVKPEAKRVFRWTSSRKMLALIIVGAFFLRLIFVLFFAKVLEFPDELSYTTVANNFVAGKGFASDGAQVERTPVYPIILGVTFLLFGETFIPIKILQALVGAFTTGLVYLVAKKLSK